MGASEPRVYRVTGPSLVDNADIVRLKEDVQGLIDAHPGLHLAIDFSDVNFLSSRALGLLVAIRKEVKEISGFMVVFGMSEELNRVMNVTRLHTLFSIYPDESSAVEALGQPPKLAFWTSGISD